MNDCYYDDDLCFDAEHQLHHRDDDVCGYDGGDDVDVDVLTELVVATDVDVQNVVHDCLSFVMVVFRA